MSSTGGSNLGALSYLFGGSAPSVSTQSSNAAPLWAQQGLFSTIGSAAELAGQPYSPFPGPTVASPSSQTQAAWNLVNQNLGSWNPYMQQAGALTQAASQPLNQQSIQNFLNPYQNYITQGIDTNLQNNILPQISSQFVSAGQSASPQQAQIDSQAAYGANQAVGQSLAGAYQGAVNSAQQQQQEMGALGAQYANLGSLQQQLGAGDVSQLASAGSAQDTLAQANINSGINQFNAQQMWPYQNLGFLSNMEYGLPLQAVGQTTTGLNTAYPQATSGIGSAVGQGALLQQIGLRKGGSVRKRTGALSRARRAA